MRRGTLDGPIEGLFTSLRIEACERLASGARAGSTSPGHVAARQAVLRALDLRARSRQGFDPSGILERLRGRRALVAEPLELRCERARLERIEGESPVGEALSCESRGELAFALGGQDLLCFLEIDPVQLESGGGGSAGSSSTARPRRASQNQVTTSSPSTSSRVSPMDSTRRTRCPTNAAAARWAAVSALMPGPASAFGRLTTPPDSSTARRGPDSVARTTITPPAVCPSIAAAGAGPSSSGSCSIGGRSSIGGSTKWCASDMSG